MTSNSIIQLTDVSFSYPASVKNKLILSDITMAILQGKWVTIVGHNGSGKSTLAKILAGLLPIKSGIVEIPPDMQPIQMVLQNPEAQIIGETVYEDLCFGMENHQIPPAEMLERAKQALEQVGLAVPLDQETAVLSGGQKQLLAIANCLTIESQVLILDEITSMLDPQGRERILQVVLKLQQQGKTIIWLTQWMEELAMADEVIALQEGRIYFEGTPAAFFYAENDTELFSKDNENVAFHRENSPCQQLGFVAPYAVQVAYQLLENHFPLAALPVSASELSEAVRRT